MKIGIVGSGNIGGTLGKHFSQAGHDVVFSSRHPEELQDMAKAVGAQAGTAEEAARFGDIIVLAIPFGQIGEIVQQVGSLEGKVLIDATNPAPGRDGEVAREVIEDDGLTATDYVAQQFQGAQVVKAFNAIFYTVLEREAFKEGDARIAVQVVGDDDEAKQAVAELVEDIGFAPQDLGGLKNGRYFEPEAPLFNTNLPIHDAEKYRHMRQIAT